VFRIGQLGDTVISLPALWVIRRRFPDAHVTLLYDSQRARNYVSPKELLVGTSLVDAFATYPYNNGSGFGFAEMAQLGGTLYSLRKAHYDGFVYLAPSSRTPKQVRRDQAVFRLLGIEHRWGMTYPDAIHLRRNAAKGTLHPHEADLLLARLGTDGFITPAPGDGCMDLQLGQRDQAQVEKWLSALPPDGGRAWLAVGPSSKMPAKCWPVVRYAEAVRCLIRDKDVWPVVFGGPEDAPLAERLVNTWGRGYIAAGHLSVRASAAALQRSRLYLGNDTGTMHLAAAAGIPCLAIFSARTQSGRWYPYGSGHRVLRVDIDCQHCELIECVERRNECLTRIEVAPVVRNCMEILDS
jgi:ADP-heptose:LPS heptosyltransferase